VTESDPSALIFIDPDSSLTLQAQIRQRIVRLVLEGTWPADRRLPSSRELAAQLEVSRNTVILACQQLLAEGYLVSRERSGLYVNPEIRESEAGIAHPALRAGGRRRVRAPGTATGRSRSFAVSRDSSNVTAEYSFIDGPFDASFNPGPDWREATRLSLGAREIEKWASNDGSHDDPMLLEEICARILPKRGIRASPDEVLITLGARQALSLIGELFGGFAATLALEEPGRPEACERFRRGGARLVHLPVDAHGIVVDERLDDCTAVYVTPSHHVPTAVTMSLPRRRRLLKRAAELAITIIEDDRVPESNYLGHPHPALFSLDERGGVVYFSSLSRVLGPWVRLGFMVGPAPLIAAARELRAASVGHPPPGLQRAAAYYLGLGHYDARARRLAREFRRRWTALRDALNHYLHRHIVTSPSMGGTAFWVRGPEDLDAAALVTAAARRGLALEPIDRYYTTSACPPNCFRMGVSAIPLERIRPGVAKLAQLFMDLEAGGSETLEASPGIWLRGDALRATVTGATLRLETVYGDPCTIELQADGHMVGCAGVAGEDRDSGRWWVTGDLWHRHWDHWAYGEPGAYYAVLDGRRVKLFNLERRLVDIVEIEPPG
jgi:GntR family transcriptional regulator / MocR family aminotransferase